MLTTNVKTDVIDADAHVVENERVWDYLEGSEEKYRPTLVSQPDNRERQYWVLDGRPVTTFLTLSLMRARKISLSVRTTVMAIPLASSTRFPGSKR
jgi:hypothetical protein